MLSTDSEILYNIVKETFQRLKNLFRNYNTAVILKYFGLNGTDHVL